MSLKNNWQESDIVMNTDMNDIANEVNAKLNANFSNITGGTVPIANGGTGASTVDNARNNLGLGTGSAPTFGSFELIAATPYIDFHYNNTGADQDIRLINDAHNTLALRTYDGATPVFKINNDTVLTTVSHDYNLRNIGLDETNIDTDYDRNYTTGLSNDNHGTRASWQWQNIFNIVGGHFRAQIAIENNNSAGSSDINMFFRSRYINTGWTNWVCVSKVFVQSSQPTNAVDGSLWAW